MEKFPHGKVVLITGGTSGLGLSCADAFARRGFAVYPAGRCPAAPARIHESGGRIVPVSMDVTDGDSIQAAVRYILKNEKSVDIIVHCAGASAAAPFEGAFTEQASAAWDVNCRGVVDVTGAVLPLMRKERRGLIILPVLRGAYAFFGHTAAAKAAAAAHLRALSAEEARFGIRASVVAIPPSFTPAAESRVNACPKGSVHEAACARAMIEMAAREFQGVSASVFAGAAIRLARAKKPPTDVSAGALSYIIRRVFPFRRKSVERKEEKSGVI